MWLSKLWSLSGPLNTRCHIKDPERDHNFDNYPNLLHSRRKRASLGGQEPQRSAAWPRLLPREKAAVLGQFSEGALLIYIYIVIYICIQLYIHIYL